MKSCGTGGGGGGRDSSLLQRRRRRPSVARGPKHAQHLRASARRCALWYTRWKGWTGGSRRSFKKVTNDTDTELPPASREQTEEPWAWRVAANQLATAGGSSWQGTVVSSAAMDECGKRSGLCTICNGGAFFDAGGREWEEIDCKRRGERGRKDWEGIFSTKSRGPSREHRTRGKWRPSAVNSKNTKNNNWKTKKLNMYTCQHRESQRPTL